MFSFSLNRNFDKIYPCFSRFARLLGNKSVVDDDLEFKSSFSSQQNVKILETLNESSPEELSKYNIPLAHIQKITNWKSKQGPFKDVNEISEVEGFGENVLKEIGKSITYYDGSQEVLATKRHNKRIKHLIVPDITSDILSSLNSAVAIHIEPTGIGWAKLKKENNTLTNWTYENFSSLPQKMMCIDTFNLALKLLRKTPPGDIYIFEALNVLGPQGQAKQTTMFTYNQKKELISMLLALINTSVVHNVSLQKLNTQEPSRAIGNRVFFLKRDVPARLFGTLIGSEKVSAETAISKLLKKELQVRGPLPYSPVIFQNNLDRVFLNQIRANKELMAQALMLGISFMDLYIRKMTSSYEALNFNKCNRKKLS